MSDYGTPEETRAAFLAMAEEAESKAKAQRLRTKHSIRGGVTRANAIAHARLLEKHARSCRRRADEAITR